MKKLTKLFFLSTVTVLSIASCNKMPSGKIASFPDNEIRFTVTDTKSFSETTASTLQSNGFKMAAIIDADNSVMFNSALAYSDGTFSVPDKHYYFPTGGTMSFYAVYPADEAIAVSDGAASLTYTHNPDDDLIAAKATTVGKQSTAVEMNFDHILSQVSIKAQGEDTTVDYKVFSVTLTAPNGGTYAYADGTWTPSPATNDYSVYSNGSGITVSANAMTAIGSPMSFVPGAARLRVAWKCYNQGTSIVVYEKNTEVNIILTKGKSTTFSLLLPSNASELICNPELEDWDVVFVDVPLGQGK